MADIVMNGGTDLPMTAQMLLAVMPELNEEQTDKFIKYYNMLTERNRTVNLTRITAPKEVVAKHFADSVLGASLIPEGAKVIDVGTGAGFPGIPLAIVRPDISLTLVDSLGKRVSFLEEVCAQIGIGARCIHARAEDAARDDSLRAHFDIALSRAVAPINVLIELTAPFLKIGGCSLMYKAGNIGEELSLASNALKELGCTAQTVELSADWGGRTIVRAVKDSKTPSRYPRKAGTAQKKPL